MKHQLKKGTSLFIRDMKQNVALPITFVLALLAFFLAFAVATGFHF